MLILFCYNESRKLKGKWRCSYNWSHLIMQSAHTN